MGARIFGVIGQANGRRSAIVLTLLVCLIVAGCVQRDRSDDENRPGGFYGGASVGR